MNNQFWIKYILRVAHIGGMMGISHKTFSDFQQGQISSDNAIFYTVLGLITIAAGFANTYVLKPQRMGENRKLWVGYHHIKLAITLLLYLPIAKFIMSGATLATIRMLWVLSIIFVSAFMRFYREKHTDSRRI